MSPAKSPSVNEWVEGSSQSSPDPLTLSSRTFPKLTTPIRARSKTPVSQRPSRSIKRQLTFGDMGDYPVSPSKSFTMDTPGNVSPWRIKVTVEAQPRDGEDNDLVLHNATHSPKKNFAGEVTKTTIPLKDADDSPPSRGRRKPRRSSGASTGVKKRKPTPARRKSARKTDSPPLLSDIHVGSSPLQKPKTRKRNTSQGRKRRDTKDEPQNSESRTDPDKISDTGALLAHAESPRPKQTSGFNFAALTPLHQKSMLLPPTNDDMFPQAQQQNKQGRSGIIPKGWTAPIFSPLPPRASPAKQLTELEESSLLDGEGQFNPQSREATNASPNSRVGDDSTPNGDNDAAELVVETQDEERDAEMWRNMIRRSNPIEDNDDAATEGAPETEAGEEDYGLTEQITGVIGDMTMMQSEEFSMVSIGSLPSARELYSSFVENGGLPQHDRPISATTRPAHKPVPPLPLPERDGHIIEAPGNTLSVSNTPQRRRSRASPRSVTPSAKSKGNVLEPENEKRRQPAMDSQPETPADGSSGVQNMSSIMRSWRRNLMPTEPPVIAGAEIKATPIKAQISAQAASDRSAKSIAESSVKSKAAEFSLLQNASSATSNRTVDATRLPTPSSSERGSSPEVLLPPGKGEDVVGEYGLRAKLQRAAEEQLHSESNISYAQSPVRETNANQPGLDAQSSPNNTLHREMIWQREREEVIRQAQAANSSRIITIPSDSEDESEDANDDLSGVKPQSDGIDIWQEEASRSADLEGSQNGKEMDQSPSRISIESNPRPGKVARSWRNISATGTSLGQQSPSISLHKNTSKASVVEPAHPRREGSTAVIRDLFKAITGTTHSPIKPVEAIESTQVNSDDVDKNVDIEDGDKDTVDNTASMAENTMSQSIDDSADHDSQYDLKSPDAQGTFFYESSAFQSSPIKHNTTTLSDIRQIRREVQGTANVDINAEGGSTMLSDVRQIRHEVERAIDFRANSREDSEEGTTTHTSSFMKALNPKKPTKPLFDTAKATTRKRKRASQSEEQITPLPTIGPQLPAPPPSLLSRMYFSFTAMPQRPTHHLLAQLPLLPKFEPWTRTHYHVLDALYQLYKSHPQAFSPYHPANKELLTPNWRHFEDMGFQNLGYDVTITRPLLVLCALFAQLLRLDSIADFERVEGSLIDNPGWPLWFAAKDKGVTEMVEFTVVVRLFTIIVGEWMREDEAKGIKVPFSGNMMWRLSGEDEWDAGRTAFWKLQAEVDGLWKK